MTSGTADKVKDDERRGSQTIKAQLSLRELVLSGELKAGERVSELAIVEKLGVSRTPVRAALIMLADEGLLELIPSGGYAVRSFNDKEVIEAIEIRGTIEGLAVRLAAERGHTSISLAPVRALLREMDIIVSDIAKGQQVFDEYVELNSRFHKEVVALANSKVIERQLERVMTLPFASPNAFVMAQMHLEEAPMILTIGQDHHRCIVDAISSCQGSRAEALMREHARLAIRNLTMALNSSKAMSFVSGASLILSAGKQQ